MLQRITEDRRRQNQNTAIVHRSRVLVFDCNPRWFKDNFAPGFGSIDTIDQKDLKLARFGSARKSEDNIEITFTYIWKEKEKFDFDLDSHLLGLFEIGYIRKIMKKVGFRATIFNGFTGRRYSGKEKGLPR